MGIQNFRLWYNGKGWYLCAEFSDGAQRIGDYFTSASDAVWHLHHARYIAFGGCVPYCEE